MFVNCFHLAADLGLSVKCKDTDSQFEEVGCQSLLVKIIRALGVAKINLVELRHKYIAKFSLDLKILPFKGCSLIGPRTEALKRRRACISAVQTCKQATVSFFTVNLNLEQQSNERRLE